MFRSHDLYRGLKFIVAFLSCDVYKSKQCNSSQGAPKRRAHNKGSFTFSHGVQNMFRQTSQGCYFRLYFFLGQIQASSIVWLSQNRRVEHDDCEKIPENCSLTIKTSALQSVI